MCMDPQLTSTAGKIIPKTEGPLNEETVVKFDFSQELSRLLQGHDFHAAKLMVRARLIFFPFLGGFSVKIRNGDMVLL